ncbi:unnamed protein product [Pleuronectes platessa]|uniref:Uncharacterized protein n=1 Tax=Pleuronectes platessa TaxID=8262 RepID=A0A9N7ULW0_PLEPL|nr:unnamed protein product [Pleuronectes platessa]
MDVERRVQELLERGGTESQDDSITIWAIKRLFSRTGPNWDGAKVQTLTHDETHHHVAYQSGTRREQSSTRGSSLLSPVLRLITGADPLVRLILAGSPQRTAAVASASAETWGDSNSRAASDGETVSTLFWQRALCRERRLEGPRN